MRSQDDGRGLAPGVGQQTKASDSSVGSSSPLGKSPRLAARRQYRVTPSGKQTPDDNSDKHVSATAYGAPPSTSPGSGTVQSLIVRYGGGRSRSRSREPCCDKPAAACGIDSVQPEADYHARNATQRRLSGLHRQAAVCNGSSNDSAASVSSGTARHAADACLPSDRPMIVLQHSADSFCSPTSSPGVDSQVGVPAWRLPLPSGLERSRKSSSGSADSAVCDLNSAAESSDSCGNGISSSAALVQCDGKALPLSSHPCSTNEVPSVVVHPGSPGNAVTGAALGDCRAALGNSSDDGVGRTAANVQSQLLLVASGDGLQRKVSSESICSEASECGSYGCESMDEGSYFNACEPVSWDSMDKQQQSQEAAHDAAGSEQRLHRAEATAAWIQLAGHRGTFLPFRSGTILKKHCSMEERALRDLMNDALQPFVPRLFGIVNKGSEKYIEIQDLLAGFTEPSVMDCKIGVRTYLEEELEKALKNPQARQDMYEKMVKVDPREPTAEEHEQRGVTKPRYMQWRERVSSSERLGFRIEAVRRSDGSAVTDFKKTRDRHSIMQELMTFAGSQRAALPTYLARLLHMRQVMERSSFLARHEVIGSSLLFIHDSSRAEVWMIDFGKTLPVAEGTTITHRRPWHLGNHEDGYLTGIDNLISILEETVALLSSRS